MGKKVYHIVDPETGEVVGKKRVGRIGQAYYKTSPKGRALFVLFTVGVACLPLTLIFLALDTIFSDSATGFWGIATIASAAVCIIGLLFGNATSGVKDVDAADNAKK